MGPEQNFYSSVRKNLQKRGVLLSRIEDIMSEGVPDCFYSDTEVPGAGFIEFKCLPNFPKKHKTKVRIDHFTPQQRAWFLSYGPRIQRVFLLLRISTTFMLFPWTTIKSIGNLNRVDLFNLAESKGGCWGSRINYDELVKLLRRNYVKES